ncbi:MAG TPA: hypothetical protein VGS19_13125 [Streptosporangiaceae bacterium]|nr:hypothetical protein [Streptosporangiaceae bacterium]
MILSVILLAALIFSVALVVAVAYRPRGGAGAAVPAVAARHTARWRAGGFGAGLCCAVLAGAGGAWAVLVVGAPLFAACVLGGVLVGELTVPLPRADVRVAALAPRRPRDYIPEVPARLLVLGGGALLVLLAAAATGVIRALAHPGSCLPHEVGGGNAAATPLVPGVSAATLVLLAAGSAAAAWALRAVARRPLAATDHRSLAGDEVLRRGSAQAVLAGWGVLVTVPLAVTAWSIGQDLAVGCPPSPWWAAQLLLTPLAFIAACGAVACVAWLVSRTWWALR